MGADRYDLVVLGSGPAGQKAAIQAAKLGMRAAVVEQREMLGGVCVHTGTVPSKTLREAAVYLTGFSQQILSPAQRTCAQVIRAGRMGGDDSATGSSTGKKRAAANKNTTSSLFISLFVMGTPPCVFELVYRLLSVSPLIK